MPTWVIALFGVYLVGGAWLAWEAYRAPYWDGKRFINRKDWKKMPIIDYSQRCEPYATADVAEGPPDLLVRDWPDEALAYSLAAPAPETLEVMGRPAAVVHLYAAGLLLVNEHGGQVLLGKTEGMQRTMVDTLEVIPNRDGIDLYIGAETGRILEMTYSGPFLVQWLDSAEGDESGEGDCYEADDYDGDGDGDNDGEFRF